MAFQFLTPKNIVDVYRTSKQYTEGLTDKFPEFERIAANKPKADIPKQYPKTTDGTTASIIRKTPHRIIQQLPSGSVQAVENEWLAVIADFLYRTRIIPNANQDYALIQKCWLVIERFLTFGFCGTYAPFVNRGGHFCTDLRLIYWGDIFIQPGKLSDTDSDYVFIRSWMQTKDIEKIIADQKNLSPKNRTWDIEALQMVKDLVVSKDEKAKTPSEREQSANSKGGVELITGFQRGVKSKFITFHMHSTGKGDKVKYEGTVVRTKENNDPRGEIPVSFAYGDIDGTSPLGRSVIELVGSMQNLLDAEVQMYQFNRALGLNPPLIKRGAYSKNKIKLIPNIIIDIGSSPDATLEPLKIDTTALANFPNNYGLMKSQMLNLLASPDTSVSSEVGNPGFSKTPQGVEASRANLSVDDNYVRRQFETWFERWSETAINLYFAEREGVEEIQLDDETATALRELAKEGKFDETFLSPENKVRINYSSATEQLKFEVDASTSKMEDDAVDLQALEGLTGLLAKTSFLEQMIPMEKKFELWNAIVNKSSLKNPSKLIITAQDIQQVQQAQAQAQPNVRDYVTVNYKDMPEDIKRLIEQDVAGQSSQMTSPSQQAVDVQTQNAQEKFTTNDYLKADSQAHQQEMDKAKLAMEAMKLAKADQAAKQKPKAVGAK